MRIEAPSRFIHTGNLLGLAYADPRDVRYAESTVEIDLRRCTFIQPSATLWCITYLLLARMRGSDCVLLIPEMGTWALT